MAGSFGPVADRRQFLKFGAAAVATALPSVSGIEVAAAPPSPVLLTAAPAHLPLVDQHRVAPNEPRQTLEVAFVADNPGNWLLHCHIMDHQMAGMMTVIRVA
jgi:Multicopper oxidase